ncbi:MAG: tRNA pseudouridine(55) synthase TruB [Planctomycetaceae bacterium]
MENNPCGLLNLDKPTGVTSRAVVDRVARPLRGVKVGHAGTLDPLASGVLVVCVGAATRLIEYVQRMPKTYRTVVRLGARSDTLDADGRVTVAECPQVPTEGEVRAALAGQVGTVAQRPPAFSARKVQGRRAYDLARAGQAVDLAPRPVTVDRIDLLGYAWPRLELEIACGGGTYIRSIARDVGEALGCGGLVEVLARTRIGPFARAEALDPRVLSAETIPGLLRPAVEAVADLPRLGLSAEQVEAVARGQALDWRRPGAGAIPEGEVALLGPDGALVAVAECVAPARRVLPRRVLISAAP